MVPGRRENWRPGEVSSFAKRKKQKQRGEHGGGRSVDVSAHGKVDEDEDVELDEDGEAEEDGVQDEAGQAQPPVQSPFVQMDTENLQAGRRGSVTSQQE